MPLGRKGIKALALLSIIPSTHAFNSAKAAKLEPEHPNFPLPLNSKLGPCFHFLSSLSPFQQIQLEETHSPLAIYSSTFIFLRDRGLSEPKRGLVGSVDDLEHQSHLSEHPDFSTETLPEGKKDARSAAAVWPIEHPTPNL